MIVYSKSAPRIYQTLAPPNRAYHGEPVNPQMEACHNDGTTWNQNPSNLRWATHSENIRDKVRHGTDNRGEKHKNAMPTHRAAWIIIAAALAGLSACGPQTVDTACTAFSTITYSAAKDTPETVHQVREFNAAYRALCPG